MSPFFNTLNILVKMVKMVAIYHLSIYLSIDTELLDTRSFTALDERNGCNRLELVDALVSN